jgi:hypothetical protein
MRENQNNFCEGPKIGRTDFGLWFWPTTVIVAMFHAYHWLVPKTRRIKSPIFCNVTLCSPLKVNQLSGGICRLLLQGRRISHARNQCEKVKEKVAVSITDRGGLEGCKTSGISHFLDNLLTDGGGVVSLMRHQLFIPPPPGEDSWYSFLLKVHLPQRHSAAARIM